MDENNRYLAEIDVDRDWEKKLPKAPEDINGLLLWLKEMIEERKRLQAIEQQFMVTRNIVLLKEFMPSEKGFNYGGITENIELPLGLWCPKGEWSEEGIQQHHEDVKRMFPNTTIHKVTFDDGRSGFAYTGTDTDTMACAVEMIKKERSVHKAIEHESAKLVGRHDAGQDTLGDKTGTPSPGHFPSNVTKKTHQIR